VRRVLALALGVLTAIGGFVDMRGPAVGEYWLREHVIGRIPGVRHAGE